MRQNNGGNGLVRGLLVGTLALLGVALVGCNEHFGSDTRAVSYNGVATTPTPTPTPPPGGATLTFAPATLPNGKVATAYSQQIQVTGGSAPYTWSIDPLGGPLPTGLTLGTSTTDTNTITGTPTTASSFSFNVQVSSAAAVGTQTYTITVTP